MIFLFFALSVWIALKFCIWQDRRTWKRGKCPECGSPLLFDEEVPMYQDFCANPECLLYMAGVPRE